MAVLPQDKWSTRSLGSKLVSPKRQVRVWGESAHARRLQLSSAPSWDAAPPRHPCGQLPDTRQQSCRTMNPEWAARSSREAISPQGWWIWWQPGDPEMLSQKDRLQPVIDNAGNSNDRHGAIWKRELVQRKQGGKAPQSRNAALLQLPSNFPREAKWFSVVLAFPRVLLGIFMTE